MLAICIDSIGDKLGTYKLLRNYSSLPFSLIQSRIKDHDTGSRPVRLGRIEKG